MFTAVLIAAGDELLPMTYISVAHVALNRYGSIVGAIKPGTLYLCSYFMCIIWKFGENINIAHLP